MKPCLLASFALAQTTQCDNCPFTDCIIPENPLDQQIPFSHDILSPFIRKELYPHLQNRGLSRREIMTILGISYRTINRIKLKVVKVG